MSFKGGVMELEIHKYGRRTGMPGGVHTGAGPFTLEQMRELKTRGVPAVVEIPESMPEVTPKKEEPSFELIEEFDFTVPKEHNPQKDSIFKDANRQMGAKYRPTDRLKAGRGVKIELYHPHNGPTIQDCLDLIEEKGGLLAGPEGLLLSWFHLGEELPRERWLLSLDEVGKLPKDEYGNQRVLSIFKSVMPTMGEWPHLIRVDGPISNKNCLMIFTYV